jgi:nucleotide-binding universal stress UspA family protein
MKKILIALDYDPSAQKIAETGYSLANSIGAKVVLVHVVAELVYYTSTIYNPIMGFGGFMDIDPMQLDVSNAIKKEAQNFLDRTKIYLNDVSIETMVVTGDFPEAILNAAEETGADILVIGSHSRRWLEEIVMGSVTEKVLKHTSVPLFIIPTKKEN